MVALLALLLELVTKKYCHATHTRANLAYQSTILAEDRSIIVGAERFQQFYCQLGHVLPLALVGHRRILPHFYPTELLGCRRN